MLDFMPLFHIAFVVALAKRTWDNHKNDFIMKALAAMFLPKNEPQQTLSEATKTASRTILVPYVFQGEEYELILPVRRKKLHWDLCIAQIPKDQGVEDKDVTQQVKKLAGPYGDFYGAHKIDLKAHQIVRNASKLSFYNKDVKEVFTITSDQ